MTDSYGAWALRLKDLKARKGHLCVGGGIDRDLGPVCGCGTVLEGLPDFMDLPLAAQRNMQRVRDTPASEEPPLVSGDDVPPPFTHANGEPCYGCQSCFAQVADPVAPAPVEDGQVDLLTQADAVEAIGSDVAVRHGAPDMTPAVPVIDPTMPYGPAEVERAILDANARLERGSKHEANLIAAADQLKIEYELAYARSVEQSVGAAADIRKANATLRSEREYRAWREAVAARDAMKAITHSLRSTVSALQSVGRSVGVSYSAPQGKGK
jgi:hypothetical protein